MTLAQRYYLLFLFEIMMVARDRPIREANQDSEAARRVRIGVGRSESIELPTRGFSDPGGFSMPLYFQQLTHTGPALSCHKWTGVDTR